LPLGLSTIMRRRIDIGLDDALFKKIKQNIDEWIISESSLNYIRHEYPPIFDDLLCLSSSGEKLDVDIFEKESLTLAEIVKLRDCYSSHRFAIFVSFVPLFKKPENLGPKRGYKFDDFIFGFVLYEIVSRKILSLSIDPCSQLPLSDPANIDRASVSSYGRTLLDSFTIHPPYFHSCCVLPIASPYYTPIPWLTYTLLDPGFDERIRKCYGEKELSITEFFTFGVAPDLREGLSSFFYDKHRQTAFVYLRFRENNERRAYELRFDYHSLAKLHVDFEVHTTSPNKKVKKVLKHQEIDLAKVDRIDPTLLVSLLFTGMYDPYFDKIVDQHIVGLKEIVRNNPFLEGFFNYRKNVQKDVGFLKNHREAFEAFVNIENLKGDSTATYLLEGRKLILKQSTGWYRTFYGGYVLDWLKREKLG
jgi:hypothetical protein